MVKIEKKADMMQFGELIQNFIILSDKELLFLKYKVVNGKVICLTNKK